MSYLIIPVNDDSATGFMVELYKDDNDQPTFDLSIQADSARFTTSATVRNLSREQYLAAIHQMLLVYNKHSPEHTQLTITKLSTATG